MKIKLFSIFYYLFILFCTIETKSNLTLDTFLNYTNFVSLSLSSSGEYLLIQTRRPSWDTNSYENSLWLYQIVEGRKKLITNKLFDSVKYKWSPTGKWIAFLLKNDSSLNNFNFRYSSKINLNAEQNIYLYSIETDKIKSISIGNDIVTALTWSQNDLSLYYSTINLNSTIDLELKNIIRYRSSNPTCIIRQINLNNNNISLIKDIINVPFLIGELLYSYIEEKFIFSSVLSIIENTDTLQIYLIDLKNNYSIIKLTNDSTMKQNLQLTLDNKNVIFQSIALGSADGSSEFLQQRLYSIDLTNYLIQQWVKDFQGSVQDYTIKSDGGVFILGQVGIEVKIYSQLSPNNELILYDAFNGSYLLISSSINSITFVFTSFLKAEEVYFIKNINQLKSAILITNENNQYDQIDLPQSESYQWINNEDNQTIQGILHYPPGKFHQKNLPLFVLIHGGPISASINCFFGDWYNWAPLAATQGWLVLEPNYRGSTGYGDKFVNQIRYQPVTRPEKDIISGIDQLIRNGIVDKNKLTIGGYSYGGILTNWLITQTTRFNAALSGAGSIEQVSSWGITDLPVFISDLFGGFPWKIPQIYQNQSAIYYFDRIRTPTHIVDGGNDIRVPFTQNIMFERALNYLKIPVELLLLNNEGHTLSNNPLHGKIKLQQEIKWLNLYGFNSTITKQ